MSEVQPLVEKKRPQVETSASSKIWPYIVLMRFHKWPVGTDLVFWPCAWGITMGARMVHLTQAQVWTLMSLYLLGSTLRHNAACIWNDVCDREFDRKVERSKTRPLASGAASMTGAVTLLLAQIVACYLMLLYTGHDGMKVGLVGLLVLDPVYPLMKRLTNWPQAVLGLAMTWGLPTTWVSILGYTKLEALVVLFLGGVSWAIYYDTIYACQDRRDDVKAGVKSTAVLFGDYVRPILAVFAAAFVGSLAYAGVVTEAGPLYFAITVGGAALCFTWQLSTIDFDSGAECWATFKANGNLVGIILWAGMYLDYIGLLNMVIG